MPLGGFDLEMTFNLSGMGFVFKSFVPVAQLSSGNQLQIWFSMYGYRGCHVFWGLTLK